MVADEALCYPGNSSRCRHSRIGRVPRESWCIAARCDGNLGYGKTFRVNRRARPYENGRAELGQFVFQVSTRLGDQETVDATPLDLHATGQALEDELFGP